jgi:hypothetical protein
VGLKKHGLDITQPKNDAIVEEAIAKIQEFNEWIDSLSPHDKANFSTLISLPKAKEIIGKMPEGKYKDMAMVLVQCFNTHLVCWCINTQMAQEIVDA